MQVGYTLHNIHLQICINIDLNKLFLQFPPQKKANFLFYMMDANNFLRALLYISSFFNFIFIFKLLPKRVT